MIGVSLSEPHTSGTALQEGCVCLHTYIQPCWPYTEYVNWTNGYEGTRTFQICTHTKVNSCSVDTWTPHYRIVGNFQGRKLSRIGEKYNFHGENFRGMLALPCQRTPCPQISQRKLLQIATKPRNLQEFSPSKVCNIWYLAPCQWIYWMRLRTMTDKDRLLTDDTVKSRTVVEFASGKGHA